jgi:hypothetical protein
MPGKTRLTGSEWYAAPQFGQRISDLFGIVRHCSHRMGGRRWFSVLGRRRLRSPA